MGTNSQLVEGELIRQARAAQGLSLRQLAERLGDIHFTTLGKIERGEMQLSVERIVRIADALGVPPGALVSADFGSPAAEKISVFAPGVAEPGSKDHGSPVIYAPYYGTPDTDMIGYVVYPPDAPTYTTVISYVLCDRSKKRLHPDLAYVLRFPTGIRTAVFRDNPPRFEAWSKAQETTAFEVGERPFEVEGRVLFLGEIVYLADTED